MSETTGNQRPEPCLNTVVKDIRKLRIVLVVGLLFATSMSVESSAQEAIQQQQPLAITFLVNEGFLIQENGKSILIDAFVKDEYYGYGALPDSAFQQMMDAQQPFDNVVLALVSHVHLDHFQVETAVGFLQKNSDCMLMASEEVVLAIRNSASKPSVANQATVVWPEPGEMKKLEQNGIRIEAFRLQHAGDRNSEVQNLGLIMHLGDRTVLHVGDADASAANFEPFELAGKKIDVAILPTWLLENRTLVDEQIGAKTYIAAHIPTKDLERVKREFAKSQPDVIVLEKPLEQWTADVK